MSKGDVLLSFFIRNLKDMDVFSKSDPSRSLNFVFSSLSADCVIKNYRYLHSSTWLIFFVQQIDILIAAGFMTVCDNID